MKNLLHAENIIKDYRNHRALDQVSVCIPEQSIYGLLGPNGAGKTTLIRIINQIIGPDQGSVHLFNEPLHPDHIQDIGYLPEERGLYKKMEIGEQALYLARLKGLKGKEAKRRLKMWFEKFDLMPWWDKKAEELSKGMQQKVQFIITVMHEPRLLIFDEPFSGFDPVNVNLLKEEIFALREAGATVIFSTHNMESVEQLCDHIALINKSKVVLEGNVRDIKKSHATQHYKIVVKETGTPLPDKLSNHALLLDKQAHVSNGEKTSTLLVKLNETDSPNELMASILPHGELISFREVTPSMNDIFIKQVTGHYPIQNNKQEIVP